MELLRGDSQRPQRVDYICKEGPTADVWLDSRVLQVNYQSGAYLNIYLFILGGGEPIEARFALCQHTYLAMCLCVSNVPILVLCLFVMSLVLF